MVAHPTQVQSSGAVCISHRMLAINRMFPSYGLWHLRRVLQRGHSRLESLGFLLHWYLKTAQELPCGMVHAHLKPSNHQTEGVKVRWGEGPSALFTMGVLCKVLQLSCSFLVYPNFFRIIIHSAYESIPNCADCESTTGSKWTRSGCRRVRKNRLSYMPNALAHGTLLSVTFS